MTGTRAGTRLGNARPLVGSRVAHLQQPSGDSDRDLLLDRVVLLRSQDQYEALPPRTAPEHNVTGGHAVKRKLSHGAGVRTSQGAGDRQVRMNHPLRRGFTGGLCRNGFGRIVDGCRPFPYSIDAPSLLRLVVVRTTSSI